MAAAIHEIAEQRKAFGVAGVIASITVRAAKAEQPIRAIEAEAESDAEVAIMPRVETPPVADGGASAPFDEDGPVWPSEAAETAFLGEEKGAGRAVPQAGGGGKTLRQAANEAEAALGPLPSLDALITRIPAEAREAVEDLFRVKFTGVKRVSPDVLK